LQKRRGERSIHAAFALFESELRAKHRPVALRKAFEDMASMPQLPPIAMFANAVIHALNLH
jgi:hypothetical protein